jgi:hypothetical protein
MGFTVTHNFDFAGWSRQKVNKTVEAATQAVNDATLHGAETMQNIISTISNTANGKTGRIDTGDMLQSVEQRVVSSGSGAVGMFGWLDHEPSYGAKYQDPGTRTIPAMNALQDAFDQAKLEAEKSFNELIREA